MSTPSIKVGQGNWGIKVGNLLGYANTEKKFAPVEFTSTRALNTATRVNASGNIEIVNANIPRIDYFEGQASLLVEPSGTNSIRNNSMVGAVVGSPGTIPTNWIVGGVGLTQQIVEVGTENGVSYIDLRLSGTATAGTATLSFESATQIAALTGQTWTISSYLKTIALPSPPTSFVLAITERTSGGAIVVQQTTNVSLTSTLARYSYSPTLNGGATTAFAQPRLFFTLVIGQTYDFTIRIGYPQMELGSVATSVIPTTTAAVTRNADVVSVTGVAGLIGQTEGAFYAEVDLRLLGTNRSLFSLTLNSNTTDFINFQINTSNKLFARIRNKSGSLVDVVASGVTTTAGIHKLACSYSSGDITFALDGVIIGTNTNAIADFTAPLNCVLLGCGPTTTGTQSAFLNDRIHAASIYQTRLPNTTTDGSPSLQSITTL